ncbi:MAG: hypothetical protein ACE5KM_21165 [Planctomycetaceae bacterium]
MKFSPPTADDLRAGFDYGPAVSASNSPVSGYSKHEIAQRLESGWQTADRIILRIREHFRDIGLDGCVLSETD